MADLMVDDNNIDINRHDLQMVKDLILASEDKEIGKNAGERQFLYEIVANGPSLLPALPALPIHRIRLECNAHLLLRWVLASHAHWVAVAGRNSIDVDKFDYLARDARMCGVMSAFDHKRCAAGPHPHPHLSAQGGRQRWGLRSAT